MPTIRQLHTNWESDFEFFGVKDADGNFIKQPEILNKINNQPEPKELDPELCYNLSVGYSDDRDEQGCYRDGFREAKSRCDEYYQFKIKQLEEENRKLKKAIIVEVEDAILKGYNDSYAENIDEFEIKVTDEEYIESIKSKYNI